MMVRLPKRCYQQWFKETSVLPLGCKLSTVGIAVENRLPLTLDLLPGFWYNFYREVNLVNPKRTINDGRTIAIG